MTINLNSPVCDLELSIRAANILNGKWGDEPIETVGQLIAAYQAGRLIWRLQCGRHTVEEITSALRHAGFGDALVPRNAALKALPVSATPWFEFAL